ncbi:MAG: hypothetical protein VW080_06435, partial [Flavobacteriaceae bacterium]
MKSILKFKNRMCPRNRVSCLDWFNIILVFTIFFITSAIQAQFNYQGVIKDNNGKVIKNQLITIKFDILYGSTSQSPVYSETHQITVPPDGVINLSVGSGNIQTTSTVSFTSIDWSREDIYLKREVNPGSGFIDFGTSKINSVPKSNYADRTQGFSISVPLNSISIGSNVQNNFSNTIQLGNESIERVFTSGTMEASSFSGEGSNLSLSYQKSTMNGQGSIETSVVSNSLSNVISQLSSDALSITNSLTLLNTLNQNLQSSVNSLTFGDPSADLASLTNSI